MHGNYSGFTESKVHLNERPKLLCALFSLILFNEINRSLVNCVE